MHAGKTLFFLYLTTCITAQQDAVAICRNLTSSTTNDGTTITTTQFPDPSCWDTLDMTDWMTDWNATTTICTAAQSARTRCQCRIDEPWATCFMRLTYAKNKTANYVCTDLFKSKNCTMPQPEFITALPGPSEIFYGAYSIWSLHRYLSVWHDALISPVSLPGITAELSNSLASTLSANHLLAALVQDYAVDPDLAQALISIVTTKPIVSEINAPVRPTSLNVQILLGQLLQQVLEVVMGDWASGDFQAMASGGKLLNGTLETTKLLTTRLGLQQKKR